MAKFTPALPKKFVVNEEYTVVFPLKQSDYAESYRVRDAAGKACFLKLFFYDRLADYQISDDGDIVELEVLQAVKHPNILRLRDSGMLTHQHKSYGYGVYDFISGETLADKMMRSSSINPVEAKQAVQDVLKALHYLHRLDQPVLHNEITNLNVMVDLSRQAPQYKLIDFGYAQFVGRDRPIPNREGLDLYYQATETFSGQYSVQSDLFSVGALYYHLLFGMPPYFIEQNKFGATSDDLEHRLLTARSEPLRIVSTINNLEEQTLGILARALHPEPEKRFSSAEEFLQALEGSIEVAPEDRGAVNVDTGRGLSFTNTGSNGVDRATEGFSAIAGMHALKETITHDVINALKERDKYAEYGLTIPNGMLLYGPPGCGKTFFAERMAEEVGFNYFSIKPSDIQSKFVNASQELIKNLFDEARKQSPSIIFLDELDALVPKRDTTNISQMNTNAVNEFLAQMNNTGEAGIFIIGATNRPLAVDPAILRSGRLDKTIYIPPPDLTARRELFKIHTEKRPITDDLDYEALGEATENFVASDIRFLCDEAARRALRAGDKISQDVLLQTIQANRPSLTRTVLDSYKNVQAQLEGSQGGRRNQIGFNRNN